MTDRLGSQRGTVAPEGLLGALIEEHEREALPRLERLWAYFRNAPEPVGAAGVDGIEGRGCAGDRGYRLAQEAGLPSRLRGARARWVDDRAGERREVVIENDIAWRVQSMVDFMFGEPVRMVSTASEESLRGRVARVLEGVWERSGGVALLQDMALLGHVYGHVDLVLRVDEPGLELAAASLGSGEAGEGDLAEIAELFRVEVIEPTRGIPILDEDDYRELIGYVVHFARRLNAVEEGVGGASGTSRVSSTLTEVIGAGHRRVFEDGALVSEWSSRLMPGVVPVVHIQNLSQPFRYEGLSEVEPLIPLQDELNTRLSDRASRVTMQTFKMYLAKGLDGFDRVPVGPGQVWSTDNMDASVEAFGGDGASPSEESHVLEIREAMDKVSGVPPIASGVVRAKIGNLSSANALRITLMGVLAKTARKRVTYGRGLNAINGMVLGWLDAAGVLSTRAADRGVRLVWPDPIPADVREEVAAARAKADLGVPRAQVLSELGYAPTDPGIE